jgi:hypothetical protein
MTSDEMPDDPFSEWAGDPGMPEGLAARMETAQQIYAQLVRLPSTEETARAVWALDEETVRIIVMIRVQVGQDYLASHPEER